MTYRIDLSIRAEDALDGLADEGRREVMETIASALIRRDSWPAPGGWDAALWFGPQSWIVFSAYPDGIDVLEVGWVG
ncbi:hypothetical protein PV735_05405 [Streptomyces turgidiscabies]|uniref:Toxin-antitoxin system, toxin component, RelE family n=1 Tax=Streptomyces turgidiscabies (strain Car8) TaxID=698760 RepID=L7EYS8_STRT8|nr:hypothetical protein [Streptomyces turgidiscabies]ELP64157.1 hypothetical protein STRTUCAR8_05566 [Streptomyces turgidiscabies Car8]MDX3492126.1 hypothetical protein [Streptomyces turgidiscabies]